VGQFPAALVLPAVDGPKPWTDKPVLNDPGRFQIAIMTDNTGGHRPGVWMKAVRKLNVMRPEFVISVGDLIEGYTEDVDEIEAQWKEFLGFMDHLEMKFFFVSGNHDVTNKTMHKIWRQHFGSPWYSFDYKGVHFLCICSEDPANKFGDEQLTWIEQDLAKNKDARWTLVFMHRPVFVDAEKAIKSGKPDPTGWAKIESWLGTRPHTVFSGHVHHYVQYDRHGMKYYHLATTGGASPLRGIPYGEFDHVAWLSMEQDGPRIGNLLLDGVLPGEVVTEKSIGELRDFLAKTRIEVAPILIDEESGFSQGRIDLRMVNRFSKRVHVAAKIDGLPLRGLTLDPDQLKLTAEPGKTAELAVTIRFADRIAFEHLAQTLLTASVTTDEAAPGAGPGYATEQKIPIIIDRKFPLARVAKAVTVDGKLDEWGKLKWTTGERPLVVGKTEDWKAPTDASLAFDVAFDETYLYVAAHVTDEAVIEDADALEIRLDTRALTARRADPKLVAGTYRLRISAPDASGKTALVVEAGGKGAKVPPGGRAAAQRRGDGYDVELAIPLAYVSGPQGANWQSVQLTAIVNDVDEAGSAPARVVWRGTADVDQRNTNWGQFVRGK
jgi:hypothetical protein